MKLTELRDKALEQVNRIGKKGTVVLCAVLLIGVAVVLNFILYGAGEKTAQSGLAIDPSALKAGSPDTAEGEEEKEAASVYNYFEAMQLSRQQARDEAMQVLLSVAESTTAVEAMKTDAYDSISQIAADIENESNIETLVLSKGFKQCVAVVNGDSASVIVKSDGLLPSEISQISEIVYEQAGILPQNLRIIEKDV